MNIEKPELIKEIIDEIDLVVEKMEKEEDLSRKLYYFSGIHSSVGRIVNIDYDSKLLFIQYILATCHNLTNARLLQNELEIKDGKKTNLIPVTKEFFKVLIELCLELKSRIGSLDDEGIYFTLEKFICHTYQLTGNGHYLQEKGITLVPQSD